MKKELIKDVPISLPDGTEVKKGMKVYKVERWEFGYSKRDGKYVNKWTGIASSYLVEHTVIHINADANSRSFTLRSDRGCEHTYSVKNSCLPQIFGSKDAAIAHQKTVTKEDIVKIEKKIESSVKYIQDKIKANKEEQLKYRTTIAQLKKLRY